MISGSTVRIIYNLKDWVSTSGVPAPLIDADSAPALNIYDSHSNVVLATNVVRDSVGTYHYDWTTPTTLDTYTLEFIGYVNTLPNIYRTNVTVTYE